MRLIRLALALVAVSSSWVTLANTASSSNVGGSLAGTVGSSVTGTTAATQRVANQTQARLDGAFGTRPGTNLAKLGAGLDTNLNSGLNAGTHTDLRAHLGSGLDIKRNDARPSSRSSLTGTSLSGSTPGANAMEDSIPRGWLMALIAVLLIGHQLRRKHRFLRPQRFNDL
jgi:hypothetical protein